MKNLFKIAAFIAATTYPVAASADVTCEFSIPALWVAPDGWISASMDTPTFSKGWWLCPLSGSTTVNDGYATRTITSDSCRGIYSMLLTQKASGRKVRLQFHGPASCSAADLPATNSQPNPFPTNFGIVE